MFGKRQLKGLKLSQIILKYVNILPAKFDFEKVKQIKVREFFSKENLGEISKMYILAHFRFEFSHVPNHVFHVKANKITENSVKMDRIKKTSRT